MEGSSFSGLFTRVDIGHMRIGSAGNGRIRSRGSGSSPSQRSRRRRYAADFPAAPFPVYGREPGSITASSLRPDHRPVVPDFEQRQTMGPALHFSFCSCRLLASSFRGCFSVGGLPCHPPGARIETARVISVSYPPGLLGSAYIILAHERKGRGAKRGSRRARRRDGPRPHGSRRRAPFMQGGLETRPYKTRTSSPSGRITLGFRPTTTSAKARPRCA